MRIYFMKKYRLWRICRIMLAVLSMAAAAASFVGFHRISEVWVRSQFAPGVLRCMAEFSAGALATVVIIAALTVVFGRIYCSVVCPFGIFQDIVIWISRRKKVQVPDLPKLRYLTAGIIAGLLAGGCVFGLLVFDPYSDFGKVAGLFPTGGGIVLVVITGLALWKRRIFCTAICPVGTVLGVLSKKSVFRLQISDKCVKCGKCAARCPVGAINLENKSVDNERCIRCMACVSACPVEAVSFGSPGKNAPGFDVSRRKFLINGGLLATGVVFGTALAKAGAKYLVEFAGRFKFLPPGAGDAVRFAGLCTGCQLCRVNCPSKIIVASESGTGQVSLDFSKGSCRFDCSCCVDVCPTGALKKMKLAEKQNLRIAEAVFLPKLCRVFQEGEKCGLCADVCPTGAVTLRKSGAPRLKTKLCIGCAACVGVCPVQPQKAFKMREIEKQTSLKG